MKPVGVYEVTGPRRFRGHEPGAEFAAALDPYQELRAIRRGSIRLIERQAADLPAGKYRLPDGWPNTREESERGG